MSGILITKAALAAGAEFSWFCCNTWWAETVETCEKCGAARPAKPVPDEVHANG
jgi:hypothetical protein